MSLFPTHRSPYVPTNRRVLLQATNTGIAIEFFEDIKEFVTYRTNIPVNDGQWHHVALVWDGMAGTITLTTDAVVVAQVEDFGQGRHLPMFGWVTLGSVESEFSGYKNERGFHGRIARLNAWNRPLDFRAEIPKMVPDFYTCGAEGFWRPTEDPTAQMVYPACAPSTPAQRVFNINMQFPSSVICNAAGQNVLSERIRHALNKLNSRWNFCTDTTASSGKCNGLDVLVDCSRRNRIAREAEPERQKRQAAPETDDVYEVKITFPSVNEARQKRDTDQAYQYNLRVSFQSKK
ncbi:Pentraxin-4 [Portunus trituberculatus]|uniref:Pentraxin-4 n=1 Tax=Portunus trituberculatus TaxID=210409 RepID=A0A5B7EJ05_PORTR|nr:Pentraxin-4 [Portunus trituberculatus]